MRRPPSFVGALMNTADGAFLVDASQRILSWNRSAEQLLGIPAHSAVGRRCHDVLAGRSPSNHCVCRPDCDVTTSVRQGRPVENFDLLVPGGRGGEVRVNVSVVALPVAGGPFTLHLLRDASRHQHVEGALAGVLQALRNHGVEMPEPSGDPVTNGAGVALTSREIEVVRAVAQGLSAREIAVRLGISRHTARHHVQNILARLGLHRREQVVAYAIRHGIL